MWNEQPVMCIIECCTCDVYLDVDGCGDQSLVRVTSNHMLFVFPIFERSVLTCVDESEESNAMELTRENVQQYQCPVLTQALTAICRFDSDALVRCNLRIRR